MGARLSRNFATTAAVVLALCAVTGLAQDQEKPPTDPLCALENGRYRVDFVRGRYCCPNKLEFWVEDLETGRQRSLHVETQVRKAEKMTMVASAKLLVTGLLERDAKAIAIVDLERGDEAGSLQDELHTYDYRLSPSHRFIVYSRRYQKEPGGERCPLLLLYDLSASPEDNRSGQPAALDVANAGRPVYPEANARQGSYDPELEKPHRYLSPFLWSADESRIVFFETFEGRYYLVTLDLAAGWAPPQVRKQEIRVSDLAPGKTAVPGKVLPIVTLAWKDETTVEIQALIDGAFQDSVYVTAP